jgi:hypothetical protein
MEKIPPNGTFPMQGIVVINTRIINKAKNMFPGFPNRFKDLGTMDRNRE